MSQQQYIVSLNPTPVSQKPKKRKIQKKCVSKQAVQKQTSGNQGLNFNQIFSFENLKKSYAIENERRPAPGVDRQTAYHFWQRLNENIEKLLHEIHDRHYYPQPLYRINTNKRKKPIYITAFRDRLVQRTLVRTLSPKWERIFSNSSYAFRSGISHQQAQKSVLQLCQTNPYIAIIDIKRFFESISHERMNDKLNKNIHCHQTVQLMMILIKHDNNLNQGLVRGAIISPLLSNFYLNDFDWQLSRSGRLVRYCDDMAILAKNKNHLKEQIKLAKMLLKQENLKINWWKKQVTRYDKGFKFLGTYFKKV